MMSFTKRLIRGAAVLLLALSAAIATPAIEFVLTGGDLYPMRWGLVEYTQNTNDDVLPPHGIGGPITCKQGITPSLKVNRLASDPEILSWQVLSATLTNKTNTQTYWTMGPSAQLAPGATFPLRPMRPHIEHARLHIEVILITPIVDEPNDGTVRVLSQIVIQKYADVYTVLGPPQTPMTKPWATFMPFVCTWGHGKKTVEEAAKEITTNLFFFRPGFVYVGDSRYLHANGQAFYLRRLLDAWYAGVIRPGNCIDVSAVLQVGHASVGIDAVMTQFVGTQHLYPLRFQTNPICAIGSDASTDLSYAARNWIMHSLVFPAADLPWLPNGSAKVYDACLAMKFDLAGAPYRKPPAYFAGLYDGWWTLSNYWYQGNHLGLVASPVQALPPVPSSPQLLRTIPVTN